jgi:hypothetical protein
MIPFDAYQVADYIEAIDHRLNSGAWKESELNIPEIWRQRICACAVHFKFGVRTAFLPTDKDFLAWLHEIGYRNTITTKSGRKYLIKAELEYYKEDQAMPLINLLRLLNQ